MSSVVLVLFPRRGFFFLLFHDSGSGQGEIYPWRHRLSIVAIAIYPLGLLTFSRLPVWRNQEKATIILRVVIHPLRLPRLLRLPVSLEWSIVKTLAITTIAIALITLTIMTYIPGLPGLPDRSWQGQRHLLCLLYVWAIVVKLNHFAKVHKCVLHRFSGTTVVQCFL
jgi:hypothetical protein